MVNNVIDKEDDQGGGRGQQEVGQRRFSCSTFEEFEGPHGHYKLKKGFLHVNYVLKRFLVETT